MADYLGYVLAGFQTALLPMNLAVVFFGTVLGVVFGALPGFTGTMGIAVLIPVTYGMHPIPGLILLVGIFCGSMYGGSISAILLHTPGTPAAAATVFDGFEMTKKGQAHSALVESAVASFWGGIISLVALFCLAPPIAAFSLRFGPIETFMVSIFGLTIIASLATKNMLKGLITGTLGLLLGTVGMDSVVGYPRFTFGNLYLFTGFNLVPALIGLFSISQVFVMISDNKQSIVDLTYAKNIKRERIQWRDMFRYPVTYIRSGIIGLIVGIVPGAGGSIASFMSYNETRRASKTPELFGTGFREGVAAAEAANNGVTGGAMIPMLTLGIPGNAATAVMLGGLMIHGLLPGNDLFTKQANIVYSVMAGMLFANLFFLVIGLTCARYFAIAARTPVNVLVALIVVLCTVGSFAINNAMFDVYMMLLFGVVGYFLRIFKFDVTPLVLGLILGPIAEGGLARAIQIRRGLVPALASIFRSPICLVLLAISILSILSPILREHNERKKAARRKSSPENPEKEEVIE